jgi:uncharacterized membrane protein
VSQPAEARQPPSSLQQRSWLGKFLWGAILFLCVAIAAYASQYFFRVPGDAHFARSIFPLRLHIAGGVGALLAGPWQFSKKLRARALNSHRWLGRIYLLSVALGSIAGFVMATVSKEGMPTHLGFGILAVAWFSSGVAAYRSIRRGDVETHRQWMVRNFALTLAAVTLRIELPMMLGILHWKFAASFIVVSWLCWVPSLVAAEWVLQRDRRLAKAI